MGLVCANADIARSMAPIEMKHLFAHLHMNAKNNIDITSTHLLGSI